MIIKVSGVSETIRDIRQQMKREAEREKRKVLKALLQDIKEENPVDTGKSRNGWYILGNSIRNDVDYVEVLNNGTSTREGSRFVEKAVLKNRKVRPSGIIVRTK
ncbi:MAG: hypothetical protein OEX12_00145 [Gammaproteobacteria bacterium]|nr:hypothetical protein [Gammaproteobacteria bacterium]